MRPLKLHAAGFHCRLCPVAWPLQVMLSTCEPCSVMFSPDPHQQPMLGLVELRTRFGATACMRHVIYVPIHAVLSSLVFSRNRIWYPLVYYVLPILRGLNVFVSLFLLIVVHASGNNMWVALPDPLSGNWEWASCRRGRDLLSRSETDTAGVGNELPLHSSQDSEHQLCCTSGSRSGEKTARALDWSVSGKKLEINISSVSF